jgi:hypothetical protein
MSCCGCQSEQPWFDHLGWWPVIHVYSAILTGLFMQDWLRSFALACLFEVVERLWFKYRYANDADFVCENIDDHLIGDGIQHMYGISVAMVALWYWDLWYDSERGNPFRVYLAWMGTRRGWVASVIWTALLVPTLLNTYGYNGYVSFAAAASVALGLTVWAYGAPRWTPLDGLWVTAIAAGYFFSFTAQYYRTNVLVWLHLPVAFLLLMLTVPRRPRPPPPPRPADRPGEAACPGAHAAACADQRCELPVIWRRPAAPPCTGESPHQQETGRENRETGDLSWQTYPFIGPQIAAGRPPVAPRVNHHHIRLAGCHGSS